MLNSIGLLSWLFSITLCSRCNANAKIIQKLESIGPMIIWSRFSLSPRTFLFHLILDLGVYGYSIFAIKSSHLKCSTLSSLEIMWNWKRKHATPVNLRRWDSGSLWRLFTTSRNSHISIARRADDALPSLLTLCFFTLLISLLIITVLTGFQELLCKFHFMSLFGKKYKITFFQDSIVEVLPCVDLSVAD